MEITNLMGDEEEILCFYQLNPDMVSARGTGNCNICRPSPENRFCPGYKPIRKNYFKIKDYFYQERTIFQEE